MDSAPRTFDRSQIFTRGSKTYPIVKKTVDTKKIRGPDSQLYTAICPAVYAIRIFGLAPYEFHNDMLVPSSVNAIYSYVCVLIYTYIIYTVLSRFMGVEMEKPLLGHTETGKAAFNYSMATFDIVTTLFTRGKFVKIWNAMQDYDEIVKNFGYPRNEKKTSIWCWVILCMNILGWTAVSQSGIWAFGEPWLNNVAYMIIYVGSSVSIIKFSGFAILLGQRFEHLNVMARKSSPSASRWLMVSPVVDTEDIERLHNSLMMAGESLNSLYSWPLLFWLANLCFHVVSDFFFVIHQVMTCSWTGPEWKTIMCLTTWIVMFLAQLILLNYACHFASSEANDMGYIMISWKRWLKNSGLYRSQYPDVESSMHLINRRLNFSAAGCFHVNLPLLRSITALFTTYLVILLQFPE